MKNTTNVFLKGMTSDMHPLTTSQQEYTDALNATLITFNGNEQMMLNDMGNTKIQDSKTGNIMGLREGFVPVGLKEHGGIMYIASVNKDGVGEIGTIPSPVIRYNKQKDYENEIHTILEATPSSPSKFYKLTSEKVLTGEKFASILLLDDDILFKYVQCATDNSIETILYPVYSSKNKKGLYNIKLYAQTDDQIFDINDQVELNSNEPYTYSVTDPNKIDNTKKYWFANVNNGYVANSVDFDVDTMLVYENSDNKKINPFVHYPNIPAGYPSVRFETENINSFSLSVNKAQNQIYPLTRCDITDSGLFNYMAIFPYFVYNTDSAVHIDKIVVSVADFKGNKKTLRRISDNRKSNILEFDYNEGNLQRYKIEDETFALIKNITTQAGKTDFNSIVDATDSKFETDFNKALFTMEIGENLDQWFILNVKYYSNEWEDEPVGEYNLKFNQYVMDVKHEFVVLKLEPEKIESEIDYREQIYDREKGIGETNPFRGNTSIPVTGISLNYSILSSNSAKLLAINGNFNNFTSSYDAFEFPPIYLYDDENERKVKYTITDTSLDNFATLSDFSVDLEENTNFKEGFEHLCEYAKITNDNIEAEYQRGNRYALSGTRTGSISVYTICEIKTLDGEVYSHENSFLQSYIFQPRDSMASIKGFLVLGANNTYGEVKVMGVNPMYYILINYIHIGEILKDTLLHWYTLHNVNSYTELMSNITSFKIRLKLISIVGGLVHDPDDGNPGGFNLTFYTTDDGNTLLYLYEELYGQLNYAGTLTTDNMLYSNTISNINATYSIEYFPYSLDPKTFPNRGDYKIIPQYNLLGLNKSALNSEYTRYGIMSEGESIKLLLSNIITEENYLSDVLLDNNIFEPYDAEMNKSSLYPSISIKKLGSNDYDTNISIPPGTYYLGSVIGFKDSPDSESHILLTFLDQLTNESVIAELYPVGDEDNLSTRSAKEGGLVYFPNGGILTNIKFVGSESDNIIIQDLGLYEFNLDFDSEPNKNVSDFILEHNKISYTPNGLTVENIGYCYATPQLCWAFVEDSGVYNDNCILKDYNTINCGMHAYQTKFGEYYTKINVNSSSEYWVETKEIINLPDDTPAYINYRIANDLS